MRVITYLSDADTLAVKSGLSPSVVIVAGGPADYIAHAIRESGDITVDDSDDMLLLDPSVTPRWAATATYAVYTRHIPVFVVGTSPGTADVLTPHALLTVGPSSDLVSFITFDIPSKGVLVSFEGGDGAGKQTQTAMMVAAIQRTTGRVVKTLDFPHDAAHCGKLIRKVLRGDCGSMREVDPLLFASLYGMNRFEFQGTLKYWLRRGYVIVLDRYVEANYGHQASKLTEDEARRKLINALGRFEHAWLGLPESHLVMYLDLPPEVAFRAMSADATRRDLDMHEKAGIDYKERVRQTFLWCAREFGKWRVVSSMTEESVRRSRDDIHAEALGYVQKAIESQQ